MKGVVAMVCLLASLGLGACKADSHAGRAFSVVTTTTQLTEWAKVIGGERVTVHGLLKPNVDPHDYEPTAADVKNIADADVIVKNGLGLESWLNATLKNAGSKAVVVDASENVVAQKADGTPAEGGAGADPHIWQNPLWAKVMFHNMALTLERQDKQNANIYANNAAAYEAKLVALDADVTKQLTALTNRNIVTDHAAFGYYCSHYRLTVVGTVIPGFDTQAALSAKDVTALVAKIKKLGVKAIFTEKGSPSKTAETIGAEAGVKVVSGGDALYADSLGGKGSDGATYIGAIRHNTKVFVDNLA
ncbi:MAG: manganese/iron transport system substrate-binding protein [Actinomycetota bacterium]|jgi:zinc/manganese transport system substrate-binding protein/manganese/iron transport system substrate-binding protein